MSKRTTKGHKAIEAATDPPANVAAPVGENGPAAPLDAATLRAALLRPVAREPVDVEGVGRVWVYQMTGRERLGFSMTFRALLAAHSVASAADAVEPDDDDDDAGRTLDADDDKPDADDDPTAAVRKAERIARAVPDATRESLFQGLLIARTARDANGVLVFTDDDAPAIMDSVGETSGKLAGVALSLNGFGAEALAAAKKK